MTIWPEIDELRDYVRVLDPPVCPRPTSTLEADVHARSTCAHNEGSVDEW